MARPAKLEPRVAVKLHLRRSMMGEVGLLLWSDAHGRIPLGELSKFFETAIQEKLQRIRQRIDEENRGT